MTVPVGQVACSWSYSMVTAPWTICRCSSGRVADLRGESSLTPPSREATIWAAVACPVSTQCSSGRESRSEASMDGLSYRPVGARAPVLATFVHSSYIASRLTLRVPQCQAVTSHFALARRSHGARRLILPSTMLEWCIRICRRISTGSASCNPAGLGTATNHCIPSTRLSRSTSPAWRGPWGSLRGRRHPCHPPSRCWNFTRSAGVDRDQSTRTKTSAPKTKTASWEPTSRTGSNQHQRPAPASDTFG